MIQAIPFLVRTKYASIYLQMHVYYKANGSIQSVQVPVYY